MASGTIRYWAAAKAAAGTAEEAYQADTLAEALAEAVARHAERPEFARVLARCSLLVDGRQVGSRDHAEVELTEGGTVEVLPPFAGGAGPRPAGGAPAGAVPPAGSPGAHGGPARPTGQLTARPASHPTPHPSAHPEENP